MQPNTNPPCYAPLLPRIWDYRWDEKIELYVAAPVAEWFTDGRAFFVESELAMAFCDAMNNAAYNIGATAQLTPPTHGVN